MASKLFSNKDRDFCRNFFQAAESDAGENITALSQEWNNALNYQKVNISCLFVGSLVARAFSGSLAAFLESSQMCRNRLSKRILKSPL